MPVRRNKRKTQKRQCWRKGGGLPAPYFNAPLAQPDAAAGRDLLAPAGGSTLRPKIGGFIPTVGEPFVAAASKYIAPLALIAGYKFMEGTATRRKYSKRSRMTRRKRERSG